MTLLSKGPQDSFYQYSVHYKIMDGYILIPSNCFALNILYVLFSTFFISSSVHDSNVAILIHSGGNTRDRVLWMMHESTGSAESIW